MKILLLGKNGQVGWELQRSLAPLGEVIACGHGEADLARPDLLEGLVTRLAPEVVVNAAAYTAVDLAESEPDLARRINAEAVDLLARRARRTDSLLVHFSTDYVFDGRSEGAYLESDPASPLNVYGRTKWAGEEAIRAAKCRHLILRTSWVYANRGRNFLRTILRLAAERDSLQVVYDQAGAPTSAELVADVTALCLHRLAHDPPLAQGASGTYHLTAAGRTSWHGWARLAVSEAAARGAALSLTPEDVRPVSTREYPQPAKRPANSCLDTGKLRRTFGLVLPDWSLCVKRLVAEIVDGRNEA